ncbi:MAG: hypothetical protein SPL26_03465 [Bacteroidales bacterium]|nr:hypothetical protein [Bacteroidales bacterium]
MHLRVVLEYADIATMLGLDGGIMHLHVVLEYADIATLLGLDGGIMHLHVVLNMLTQRLWPT